MAGKLFLGGISPNTTNEDIENHFSRYGNVIDAVVMYKDGKHRGFGFVTFDTGDPINMVLSEEQVIDGRTVDVKPAVPQGEAPPPRQPQPNGGCDYGGPPPPAYPGETGPCTFGSTMPNGCGRSAYGCPSPPPPGAPSGRHYTHYEPPPPAACPPPAPRSSSSCDKVFIGGLAQTTTDEMVRDYFAQYGNIVDCVVMKDRGSQRSRGFGFVQYDSPGAVDQVMTDYSNHQLEGKWIEVKRAIPQDRMATPNGGNYSPGAGKGYNPSAAWAGRSYGPPAYPAYGYHNPHPSYAMGGYSPYGAYPYHHHQGAQGAYVGMAARTSYRQRPY